MLIGSTTVSRLATYPAFGFFNSVNRRLCRPDACILLAPAQRAPASSRTIAVRLTRDVCKSQSFEEEPSPSPSKISNYKTNPLRVAVSSPIKEGTQLKRDGPRTPSRRTHRGGPPKFRFNSSENLTGTLAERPVCARVMPERQPPASQRRQGAFPADFHLVSPAPNMP
jgi:hypothetical protein